MLIGLTVRGPRPTITGYPYFWVKDVEGADCRYHCHLALKGQFKHVRQDAWHLNGGSGTRQFNVEDGHILYVCGVSNEGWGKNLHIAIQPDATASPFVVEMLNGQSIIVAGGRRLKIDPLPDGWGGRDKKFTTCRNFQFAVQHFGVTEMEVLATPAAPK